MQVWVVHWHVWTLTHDPRALGAIGLARFFPIVLLSLVGGAVADSWDRRRVMFATQSAMAVIPLILAAESFAGHISVYLIYALMAAGAVAVAFDNPARQSLLPNLVPREEFPNAAALNSTAFQCAQVIGPLAGGLLIERGMLGWAYLINSLSFVAVLIALAMMRLPPSVPHHGDPEVDRRGGVSVGALLEGLQFVYRTPILVWTMALDFFATFFSSANSLLPVFATDILGVHGRGYGLLAAAQSVGSLGAGAILATRPSVVRQGKTVIIAVAIFGVATVVFGVSRRFWLTWLALAVVGASDTVSTILRQTIRQLVSPDRLRGRMTSINMIFFMGGPQLGELEAGLVAGWLGAPASVIIGGVACLAATAWVGLRATALRAYRAGSHDSPSSTKIEQAPAAANEEPPPSISNS
jgi:MFS family permease